MNLRKQTRPNTTTKPTIYTIGHSTRDIEEFIAILKKWGIKELVDVRSIPRSCHNPQYEHTALETSLPDHGISYRIIKDLGGLRPKAKHSTNTAWRNASFRNYADYMQTESFEHGLEELMAISRDTPTAIMCAEAVPWRCHRSLVGDALLAHKFNVKDIMNETTANDHKLTSFAKVSGTHVTYPAED